MACVTCIGCGAETRDDRLVGWHTGLVELGDVGSRTTAKIRLLHFCPCCEPVMRRFGEALLAKGDDAVPRAVTHNEATTLDERPAFLMDAVPVMAR
jgi:hypothetical protein